MSVEATSFPRVSVLIDTYNHERFIERAITSVLDQDMPMDGIEILVVDDGSTDRTPEIVRRFEPRVRLIRKTNGGQASAFNIGIPECRGDIVAFLDGDDWWAPQKLRLVLQVLAEDSEVGIVGNGITQVLENGSEHSEVLLEGQRFRIDSMQGARLFRRRKSQLGTSRMTVRTEILRSILPIPEQIVIEADEYIFTLAAAFSAACVLSEPLTFYRIHGGNLFQITGLNRGSLLRKQRSIEALTLALREKLAAAGLPGGVVTNVVDAVKLEADLLRLRLLGGSPWEMVRAEWKFYRIVHEDAPVSHMFFKLAVLIPALFCPPRLYYDLRQKLIGNRAYLRARKLVFPVPEPRHIARSRRLPS